MKIKTFTSYLILTWLCYGNINAQITERERPEEWDNLIEGGRFADFFLPIPIKGTLTEDTWGADNVIPRDVDNGIEDPEWSYWGGNIKLGDDGKYHLFVARWREDSSRGHGEWGNSIVVRAVANNSIGPYKVKEVIGAGHNPEVFQLADGRYVIYVIDGYYISDDIKGPWEPHDFQFKDRDRPVLDGLSNLTFAQREDGSFLMINRGGGVWFSQTGISPYHLVTQKSAYPAVEGRFEDPVVWRDNIQYHMIVNDWLGRIAYYLRSKDGIHWKVDSGEAYMPGIAQYEDGTKIDWFKYERMKVLQDELGRATQANFAVIDVLKAEDKGDDNHSSKNISIPLIVGRQIEILGDDKINEDTESIHVKIKAEEGFNPHEDMNINSLRFGTPEEVNFGRGSKVKEVTKSGSDIILAFDGTGNGLTEDNFAAKLLGKTSQGELLFGYARLPWVDYIEPALSARLPKVIKKDGGYGMEVEIQNFGQVRSKPTDMEIEFIGNSKKTGVLKATVPALEPFEKTTISLVGSEILDREDEYKLKVSLYPEKQDPIVLEGKIVSFE